MDENNPSGGTTAATIPSAPATPAAATPPAAQAPSGLTAAEVQSLLDQRLASLKEDLGGVLKGSLQEYLRTQEPRKPGQEQPAAQVPPAPPPTLQDDPAYKALLTKQEEQAIKYAEIERRLVHEQTLRESAESKALEQERFQSVFGALTDMENPSRTDADGGQIAAKYLLSQQKIARSQNGTYYVETRDPTTGEAKTVPVKDFVQGWLQTKEGQRFRPALPSGSGMTSNFANPAGTQGSSRPLSPPDALGHAWQQDMAAIRGSRPTN